MALSIGWAVELGLGADLTQGPGAWTWTDASPWVRAVGKLATTQGRQNGFSQMPPATLGLVVDNAGGRWVARNLAGPWYGQIRRNIPIRMLADTANYVQVANDDFTRTRASLWGNATSGQKWTDSGSGGSILGTDWQVNGTQGIHSVPAVGGNRMSDLTGMRQALADVRASLTVSCPVPTGGNLEPGNIRLRRIDNNTFYLCRVQILPSAAVQVVIFRNRSGSTTLAGPTTVPGLTHSAGTPLNIEAETYGSTIRMRVWQGSSKPSSYAISVVDTSPLDQPGIIGIRSGIGAGNTNALPVLFTYDNVLVEQLPVRFEGQIDQLPVTWDPTARDSVVGITASGPFRRMQQGTGPATSAIMRALTSRTAIQPVQYWPMEDPAGSTSIASAVPGALPMVTNGVTLGSYSGVPGSAPFAQFTATGYATGPIPLVTGNTAWAVRTIVKVDGVASPVDAQLIGWSTTSAISWRLVLSTGNAMILRAIDSTGTQIGFVSVDWTIFYGRPVYLLINASQSGADIAYSMQFYDILASTTYTVLTGTLTTRSIGWPTQAAFGFGVNTFTGAIGHAAFYSDITAAPFSNALYGWIGNTATNRIQGVCQDAGIPVSVLDDTTGKVSTLGPQPLLNTLGLIQDAANVDGGILYERGFGVYYLARYERYNRPVELTLNHALKQLSDLKTADDDQASRNYEAVSRSGGSRGAALNQADINRYQLYDEAVTLNLQFDSDTVFQAQWRVNLGTVDDIRIPQLTLNFAATPQLLAAWKKCWIGSRIQITNPPPELGVTVLDLHIEGWTETIDPGEGSWLVVLNCSSARPWQVFEIESTVGNLDALDGDDSTLATGVAAAVGGSAGTLSVATVAGSPLWSTSGADYPAVIGIDGEPITVTAVTGSSSPQSFTVTRGPVAIAHSAGAKVSLWQPGVWAL